MKSVFSVLLMVLSLLIGFQPAIIVMHFKLNQNTIEQEFCINKNAPELQCHGTCFLRKKLQEADNSDSASIKNYQRVDMLPISIIGFEVENWATERRGKASIYRENLYIEPCREILVPPPIA